MSFAIHPYITDAPHRIDLLERLLDSLARDGLVFMQGDEIANWYLGTASNV